MIGGYDLRRELNAAALNADDDEIVRAVVQLDDLVGHAPAAFDRTLAHRALRECFGGAAMVRRNMNGPGGER